MSFASSNWLIVLLDASFKSLLLIGLTAIVLLAVRVKNAAVAHRAWTAVLIGMLLLPLLSALLPAVGAPIPVGVFSTHDLSSLPAPSGANRPPNASPPEPASLATSGKPSDHSTPVRASELIVERGKTPLPAPVSSERLDTTATPSAIIPTGSDSGTRPSAASILFALYLAGVGLLAMRLLGGMFRVARLCDRSRFVADSLRNLLQNTDGIDASEKQVMPIYESTGARVPLIAGWFRPRIVLPADWREWTVAQRSAVLLHEREHLRRSDPLVNLLAEVNCCLYWFHPLAWLLARRLSSLAETCCDDAAIRHTGDRFAYARHLVEIARSLAQPSRRAFPVGLGMARTVDVQSRVTDIIDVARPLSRSIGRRGNAVVLAAIAPVLLGLAVAKLAAATDAVDQAPKSAETTGTAASRDKDGESIRKITKPIYVAAPLPQDVRFQQKRFPDIARIERVFAHRPFGHARRVSAIVFADDDKTLLTATSQGVFVWNIERQELVNQFPSVGINETLLAMNKDRNLLAIASDRGDVRVLDWPKGETRILSRTEDFKGERYITKIAMSPDGAYLALGFRRWGWSLRDPFDWSTPKPPQMNDPHLVTEGGFEIWDIEASGQAFFNQEVDGAVTALDWSSSDDILAVGRIDGSIKFVDVRGKSAGDTLHSPNLESPVGLRYDSVGKRLACVTIAGSVALWRVGETKPAWSLAGAQSGRKLVWQNSPGDVYFDETHHQLIAASNFSDLLVCDVNSGKVRQRMPNVHWIGRMPGVSSDAKKLAIARHEHHVEFLDLQSSSGLSGAAAPRYFSGRALSPNGEILAILEDKQIRFLRVSDGSVVAEAACPAKYPRLVWSPDSSNLAIADSHQSREKSSVVIDLIDAKTAKTVKTLNSESEYSQGVAFTPDGRTLVEADAWKARIWDLSAGKMIRQITIRVAQVGGGRPGDFVDNLSLSSDGRILAVMVHMGSRVERRPVNESSVNCVELYDFPSREHMGTLYCPGRANGMAFSRDGKILGVAASEWATTVGVPPFPRLLIYDVEAIVREKTDGWIEAKKRLPGDSRRGSSSVSFDTTADHVLLADGAKVTLWDCKMSELVDEWEFPVNIREATLLPDGKHFVTMNSDGSSYLVAFDPDSPKKDAEKTK